MPLYLLGANFTSTVIEGSVNATIDIYGGIKGYIENSLTEGNVEIIAAVKDITTNETTGEQILYFGAVDGKEIDMPFKTSIKFVLKEQIFWDTRNANFSDAYFTKEINRLHSLLSIFKQISVSVLNERFR